MASGHSVMGPASVTLSRPTATCSPRVLCGSGVESWSMALSVVVPTLNGREELVGCLDALAEQVPDAEIIVVNGPSADGTTGMVRDRSDVEVLAAWDDRPVAIRDGPVVGTSFHPELTEDPRLHDLAFFDSVES